MTIPAAEPYGRTNGPGRKSREVRACLRFLRAGPWQTRPDECPVTFSPEAGQPRMW